MSAAFLALAALTVRAQEEPPAAPAPQQDHKEEIRRCIEWLGVEDPEIRALARRRLLELGKDSVPQLEEILAARDLLEIHRLLKDIEFPTFSAEPGWLREPDILKDEDLAKLPKLESTERERYVHARFLEAVAHYRARNYQRAFDMANALIVLEPRSRYAEEMKKLRRACDNMILQTSMLKSTVMASSPTGVVGQKLEFTLRMENVFREAIRVGWGEAADAKAQGYAVVEVVIECLEPRSGTVTMFRRDQRVQFDREIDIAVGGVWEKAFEVDTSGDFMKDAETLRRYTVGAWTQPSTLETKYGNQPRKIVYMATTTFVVPPKYEHLLADPVQSLGRALEVGDVSEVFMAAMLAPEARRDEVAERLLGALEKAELAEGRAVLARMLIFVTGEKLGDDPRAWREWWERRKAGRKKP